MSRRKEHPHEELPFVALMDTMTNVVGVLIIVLVMIGIGLASSVNKVLSELPPVTPAELAKLKEEVTEAAPKEDPKKIEEEKAKLTEALKKATEELKTMDVTTDTQKSKITDLDELSKQIEARKKERDLKKAEVEKLLAEIEKLKARLDTTPVYVPEPATIVRLPNPRAMPENAEIQRFLIAGGRVVYLNDDGFIKLVTDEVEKNGKPFIVSRETMRDATGKVVMAKDRQGKTVPRTRTIYDQKKLLDHFSRLRIGTREMKLELLPAPNSPRLPVKLTPTPDGGETLEQLKNPASVFQRAMRKFKSEPNTVVWFLVYKDSIAEYLAAREIADQVGVPVVWEIYGANTYQRALADVEVTFTPPKPTPTPPPTATPAVRIAPPKTGLD